MNIAVEQKYQEYLRLVKLDEGQMPHGQRVETRRAFFAGAGSTLLVIRDEVSELDEDDAVKVMQDMSDLGS